MKIGMDHNVGLTDEQDISEYVKRDVAKRSTTLPYKIVRDEIVGRHMVAARNIKAGEIILVEAPLTFGPLDTSSPICLGCYDPVKRTSPKCPRCKFPVCSESCSEESQHKDNECEFFVRHGFTADSDEFSYEGEELAYAIVSPIRALMLRERDPISWNLLWMQMSHHEARRESEYWKPRTKGILDYLKNAISLPEEDLKAVEILLGIFLVNDFEISIYDRTKELLSSSATSIRAIFGLASMPNHCCVANTTHDFSSGKTGFVMTVRALVAIKEGEDITHSYTEPLDHVLTRRSILKLGKFFQCNCIRCRDPTEMGTYSSALVCSKCPKGNVISSNVDDLEADWKCDNCDFKMDKTSVLNLTAKIKAEGERIEPTENYSPKVSDFESFLTKSSKFLHHNHVIMIDKKYTLAKMYGRMKGYEPDEMSDEQFQRKRDLCQEVLKVLDKIMPGRSRKRGMMMYELHLPLVMLANRSLQRGPGGGANPDQIKADLKAGLFNLRMGIEILKDEPEDTFESKIVEGSKESIEQLEQWVKTVCDAI